MPQDNDTFGPWTPPGRDGRSSDEVPGEISTGEPTTEAIEVDSVPFWQWSTLGILDSGERGPWDKCMLGAHSLPGMVHVSISKPSERKLDIKSPKGKTRAKITVNGWEPAEVEIQCLLWTPVQLIEWRKIRVELRDPTDSTESDPLEIVHPVTDDSGITSILVKRISGMEDGQIPGTKVVKISGVDWVPQPKVTGTGTPKGAKSSEPYPGARSDAETAWLALIRDGADVAWEDVAQAHGLNPPGDPPPIPPGIDADWDTPGYWEEDERPNA